MRRAFVSALLAAAVAACGDERPVTAPTAPSKVRVLAAIGTDSTTGATIETDLDDYAPGGSVYLTGRGWAPNESVHLVMTEYPDVHEDVVDHFGRRFHVDADRSPGPRHVPRQGRGQ